MSREENKDLFTEEKEKESGERLSEEAKAWMVAVNEGWKI